MAVPSVEEKESKKPAITAQACDRDRGNRRAIAAVKKI
jgi:hypothetical protein